MGAFFALYAKPAGGPSVARALEGPVDVAEYEGGERQCGGQSRLAALCTMCVWPRPIHLPRSSYPIHKFRSRLVLEAFNPLIPANADDSGIPIAVLRYTLTNRTNKRVSVSVCGSLPNFHWQRWRGRVGPG